MAVTNAERITRETSSPTVRRFQESQSLPARARRQQFQTANDNNTLRSFEAENDDFSSGSFSRPTNARSRGRFRLPRAAGKTLFGAELWIASTCSFFQFIFGLIAIVFIAAGFYDGFFGLSGDEVAKFASTWIGGAAIAGVNFVGFFFGFHIDLPPVTFTSIGLACWGIALIFTVGGYATIGLSLWFQGINVFKSIELSFLTAAAVAADAILVTQLFPWMFVWVFAAHTNQYVFGNPVVDD